MTDQPLTHKSEKKQSTQTLAVLETTNKNGIKCVWSGNCIIVQNANSNKLRFSWNFDWNELEKTGIDGLSGQITVTSPEAYFAPRKIEVNLTANPQIIETTIENLPSYSTNYSIFEYELFPNRSQNQEEVSYDELFLSSELNDTILVIDEKRLHVNKVFLSYHSEFFRTLFSSKFKEGQMDEIPIKDVSYEDFGLLMSTIYPKAVHPNDKTVEKLLELADRFLIPFVIGHVEYHLLNNSRINSEKMIWMADKYGMTKLFEKTMRELDTVVKAKKLQTSPEYKKLSNDAKAAILDRLIKLI
ncbi:hypothetical protein CAEBREN_32742 [Caenorhabditis brenneri]|uniref:BTB domain-containing protein n=1 Tax=Caenorhabditis brenneri TaxID=135651 RepID=G0MFX9_CAEBE|nr:hypothetical protein CAEBREN_32742 [Caenorhabditis brenneri]